MLIQAGRYLVKHYLKNLEEDQIIEEFFNMDVIIGASPFGILERNRQWTRYLQAVQPFYDIIVVYAGQSHVVNTLSNDLPYMLKTPHFISLFLFPMEKTPTEIAQDYTTMEKRIKQQNLGLLDESFQINQEIQRLSSELQQTDGDCSDSSKPCWGVQDLPSNQDSAQRGSKEGVVFLPITGVKMPDINRPAPTIHEAQSKKQPQKKQDSLRYGNSYI